MRKTFTPCFLFWTAISCLMMSCSRNYDLVILNGIIIDGTGSRGYRADIGIQNGLIVRIGNSRMPPSGRVIDAQGKYVVPGFIDIHNHSDSDILNPSCRSALNYLTQGVTTLVTGNCGFGTYNVADFFSSLKKGGIGLNIVHLVGHNTLRQEVMGYANREPTQEELQKMRACVEKGMREGAAGLSTGLFYPPGSFAKTSEIISLCEIVRKFGGFYATHIRDESNYSIGLKNAIREAIEIGEKSGIPVQISHLKALGKPVWGEAQEVCGIIEAAQKRGVIVYADQYPYSASSTWLAAAVVPRWAQADGKMRDHLRNASELIKIKEEIADNIERRGGANTLVISWLPEIREFEGKNLKDISLLMKKSPVDAAIELLLVGDPSIIAFDMVNSDLEYFMKQPFVMTSSDGEIPLFGQGLPHPRIYGTFTRKIRAFVLDHKVLSLEQAVRAATGLPATMLGLKDRGLVREGYIADITIFDSSKIRDKATYEKPHQYSEGIDYVLIDGKTVIDNGVFTGILAGKPLSRSKPSNSL